MHKPKKLHVVVVMLLVLAAMLAACGDPTATTAPTTTAAATKAPTTTAAATTAATTTTAAATTAAATTTAVATTAATTTAVATTTAAAGGAFALSPITALKDIPANAAKGGKFTTISLANEIAPVLHPYPSAGDYTDSVVDADALLWGASLVTYNYNTLKWELDAAKDVKASADGKTFTFTLRSDLKWSDGSPITVDDYQYAFDNISKEDKTNADANYVGLDDVKKVISFKSDAAAATITETLDEVYAPDLALNYVAFAPVPKKVWGDKPFFDAAKNPEILKPTVTSGAYTVESWDPKAQGVLKPNPNWYRGKANFDQVIFKGGSASTVLEALKTGQADWSKNIPSAQYQQAKADPTLTMYDWSAANGTYRYVEYNTKRAPMDDKAFRQAINFAIDRDNLIKLAEAGLGTGQFSFVNPQSPYYNKTVNEFKYNLETAKKTLADAGYKLDGGKLLDKTGKAIELTVVFPTSSNPRKLIATYLEQQLKQIGVTVKVDGKEFNAYVKQVQAKDFDISLAAAGGGFPDPDSFKANIITGGTQNNTGYSNTKVDDIFKQGGKELDTAKRKALYDEAQKLISDDSPVFFLWNINSFSPMVKKIGGVVPNKGSELYYNDALTRWYASAS